VRPASKLGCAEDSELDNDIASTVAPSSGSPRTPDTIITIPDDAEDFAPISDGQLQKQTACDVEALPSKGSASHASGDCKRCNFFAKGRCSNGQDCEFCHYPHFVQKPSRQEKRERKSAWLEKQQSVVAAATLMKEASMRVAAPAFQPSAMCVPPAEICGPMPVTTPCFSKQVGLDSHNTFPAAINFADYSDDSDDSDVEETSAELIYCHAAGGAIRAPPGLETVKCHS
jgi:hypothetical protein